MKPLISRLYLVFVSAFIVCFSANASTVRNGFSEKIVDHSKETNAVRVRCFIDDEKHKLSVATVLNSKLTSRNSDKLDVALTTGHGLVDENGEILSDCYVYGPRGRKVKVKAVKVAPNFKESSATDWGILVFKRIKAPGLIRYSVDPSLSSSKFDKLAAEQAVVRFSAARGILENRQKCHLQSRRSANLEYKSFDGILPHSCKAVGGQSGSPVSVAGVDNDIVIGIHLGNSFSLPLKNVRDTAGWFGFMRIIDDKFLAELEKIVNSIEQGI